MFHSMTWNKGLALLSAAALVALFSSPLVAKAAKSSGPKPAKASKSKHVPPTEDIFTNRQVLRIEIEIPEPAMKVLREYRWEGFGGGGGEQKRPSVKATVRENGKTYADVAIHLKGAAGSFRPIDSEPALTLNFDKHVKGQTFHGLERISLNNSVQDRSLLNEQLCRELFLAAGVPVPRATQAKVQLNGRDLGVYVLVEAANKQFLARHFKNPNGNLYDGGFLRDITDPLDKSSGTDPNDRSDLQRLADAAMERNATNRFAKLSQLLDLDRFITYLALDVMMCDWDGYAINRNNYRIYHDPDSDKIVFIPHGLDQMFGVMRVSTDMPIFPRMQGIVAHAVLQTAEGRQRYRARIEQLMSTLFRAEAITNRVWQRAAEIRPVIAERGPGAARAHDRQVDAFCQRIVDRDQNIRQQLTAPDQSLKFTAGVARLANWQSRIESGQPMLDETAEGGKKLLHISVTSSSVGVWSTRVRLEPGHYRLQGRAKTRGLTPDPGDRRGGAGLRISQHRFVQKLTGDTGWTDIAFEFDMGGAPAQFGFMGPITDENPDIELICELRAAKGEAWFDRDSLRLVQQ
jgi:spore coat protein CotH